MVTLTCLCETCPVHGHVKHCLTCFKPLQSNKRRHALYCSPSCRVLYCKLKKGKNLETIDLRDVYASVVELEQKLRKSLSKH